MRVSRDVSFAAGTPHERTLTFGLDTFNLTNRVNDSAFVGTIGSPLFQQPVSVRPPRQLQFSVRFKF
jgi:hypothetical protein